jgi:hypothetical protein
MGDAQIVQEVMKKKNKIESCYWYIFYDYIVKRSNDLGQDILKNYIKPELMRELTRREQTDPMFWIDLPKSAEASDDSLLNANFNNPLLKIRRLA